METHLHISRTNLALHRLVNFFFPAPHITAPPPSRSVAEMGYHLMIRAMTAVPNSTALTFLPIMERTATFGAEQWAHLAERTDGREVIIDNDLLKVVLIRWAPGHISDLHGHPKGGGVFKVLEGSIAEARHHTLESATPFSEHVYRTQATSYIDDTMGVHTVGNPFAEAAVTLHAYLKYR